MSQPCGPSRPVTGIALSFYYLCVSFFSQLPNVFGSDAVYNIFAICFLYIANVHTSCKDPRNSTLLILKSIIGTVLS
jgi:hypothetical protein